MSIPSGTRFGPYEILSRIGAGGMGEVYRAHDPRVGREVAIKVLPAACSQDAERVQRFEHEARAAAALSHPSILSLYDVGIQDGFPFLVLELLVGETLRTRLSAGRLSSRRVLDFATQIAHGLAAAHEKGIIHRDLKPENIFITKDGRIKILDFGLAKLTQPDEHAGDVAQAATVPRQTEEGIVFGTILYMSPEQIRGKKLDHRTDIFSFGMILYEMLAGKHPFHGRSNMEVIHSILETDLPALPPVETPPALERIAFRCLEKNPEHRFQSTSDLSFALESLSSPTSAAVRMPETQPRRKLALLLIGILFTLFAISIFIYRKIQEQNQHSEPFQKMKITRLTTTGNISDVAISPDGKYVAYVAKEGDAQSLWVRQVAATNKVLILPAAMVRYQGVTFSRDGNFLYYVISPPDKPRGALYQIPVLGGTARRLTEDVYSPVAVSPDNRLLAFVGSSALRITDTDGHDIRTIEPRKPSDSFSGSPAWAPDGKTIAIVVESPGGYQDNLITIDLEKRTQTAITSGKWFDVQQFNWLSDGAGFAMVAKEEGTGYLNYQLWYLSYPKGEIARITNDLNDYRGLSLSADSSIVSVRLEQASNIWIISRQNPEPKRITFGTGSLEGLWGISWTADGKILYTSAGGGNEDLWITTPDGTNSKQLTTGPIAKIAPSCCRDGKYIVFMSRGDEGSHVWRMGTDGGNLKQLTDGASEGVPVCAPDGRSVIYVAGEESRWTLQRVSIDGGEPVVLTDMPCLSPAVSPDGKRIACAFLDDQRRKNIAVIPSGGGQPIRRFPLPTNVLVDIGVGLRWTRDGQAIAYVDNPDEVSNLWMQPLDGGNPKRLTNFTAEEIFSYDFSRSGELAITRGNLTSDVVLIRDVR